VPEPGDMELIGSRLDFVGLNMYAPVHIRADEKSPAGFAEVPHPETYPRLGMPWLYVGPQIAYWGPRLAVENWGPRAVYITENGCASDDRPAADGEVYDTDRVMYVRNHLIAAHRAVSEGWPLKGYFLWSLLDNFEWNWGYTKRFGIVYVNYETQQRTPKLSAHFYRRTIARGAVS
jgi:beta-glucosidase